MNPLIAALLGVNNIKANPDFGATYNYDTGNYEVNGVPVDTKNQTLLSKSGTTTSPITRAPYQDPSFWTKVGNPTLANQISEANIGAEEGPMAAQQLHDITQGITARDFSKVKGATSTPISQLTDTQGAIMYPNPTAPALQVGNENVPRNLLGVPSEEASAEYNKASNLSRQLMAEGNLGQPEEAARENFTGAMAGTSGNINRNLFNNILEPYIPSEAHAEGVGAQNQLGLNLGAQAALPYKVRQGLNEAMLGAGLSDVDLSNLPTLKDTRQSQISSAARAGAYPETLSNPLYVDKSGQVRRNPYFGGLLQSMQAKLGAGGTSGMNNIPIGGGLNIISNQNPAPATTNSPDMGTKSLPQRSIRTPVSQVLPTTAEEPTNNVMSAGQVNPAVFAGANNQPGPNNLIDLLKKAGPQAKRLLISLINSANEVQGGTGQIPVK